MSNFNKVIAVLLSLVCCFSLCACSAQSSDNRAAVTDNAGDSAGKKYIQTDFGAISFPDTYEEIVQCEKADAVQGDTEDGNIVSAYEFYATLSKDEKVKVYTVYFSSTEPEDKAYYIGSVPDGKQGRAYVYFVPEENIIREGMTEEEEEIVYSAQETVNDVVTSVKEIQGFKN